MADVTHVKGHTGHMTHAPDEQITTVIDRPHLSVMDGVSINLDDDGPLFPMTFRGYDRDEVEAHLGDLARQIAALGSERTMLLQQLADLRHELSVATAAEREAGHPSYKQMGERIAQIFALAEAETAELRTQSSTLLERARQEALDVENSARASGDEIIDESRAAAAEIDAQRDRRLAEVDAEITSRRNAAEAEIFANRQRADAEIATKRQAADTELAAIQQRRDEVAEDLKSLISRITTAAGGE